MTSTPPPKRIKREPLAPSTSSSGNTENFASGTSTSTTNIKKEPVLQLYKLPVNGGRVVKPEPVSDKEDESGQDDDELTSPDPDKPKKYRRIRILDDDDDGGRKDVPLTAGASGNESDDDDEYVPLVQKDVSSSSSSTKGDSDASEGQNESNSHKRSTRKNRVPTPTPSSAKKSKVRKKGVKTRRQKAAEKSKGDPESSDASSSVISETRSLDGFIVGDDESASDPDDADLASQSESSDTGTRKTRSKAKKKSGRKTRPKKKKESSTSSNVETGSEDDSNSTSSPPHKSKRRPSGSPPQKKKVKDLRNDVLTEVRGIMPACVGVTSRRRKKRNRSGAALVHGDDSHEEQGQNSDDSFIDNSQKVDNTWNLESSSESDQEVVEEDPSILELDSDTYEPAVSSAESGSDDSSSEERSQSSSDDEQYRVQKNIFEHGDAPRKCDLCKNLEGVDVRHRDDDATEWCKCGSCKVFSPLMTNYDRICCKEIKRIQEFLHDEVGDRPGCIAEHFKFQRYVLEYKALLRANKKEKKQLLAEFNRSTDLEKVAKCKESFLKWIFGKVEWTTGIPMVVPSCVVAKIRQKHAKTGGPRFFDPFKVRQVCKFEMHCRNAKYNV